jgi:pimeloyl-ACP methyl ester carboxylesterase
LYWALLKDAAKVASRLAHANKTNKKLKLKGKHMNTQQSNQQQNKGSAPSAKSSKTIVLVHGGFVDGSGWAGVHKILKNKGYNVLVVQNPTKSLADDVATTKAAIDSLDGDVVLVGHSYGAS